MRGSNGTSVLRRMTGLGAAGGLALAILTGGCVLAATAGPRQAQATEQRALQQTVNGLTPADKTIVVSSDWQDVNDAIEQATGNQNGQVDLSAANFNDITSQLHRDYGAGVIPLAPQTADWWSMTTGLNDTSAPPPRYPGDGGQVAVTYLSSLGSHSRLIAGSMPDTAPQPAEGRTTVVYNLQVVVTQQTADKFSLRPGSQLSFLGPADDSGFQPRTSTVNLDVTGIIAPTGPDTTYWADDAELTDPVLVATEFGTFLDGAVIADPGELGMVQRALGEAGLRFAWNLPLDAAKLNAQPQAVVDEANQIANQTPSLTGGVAPMAAALSASTGLVQPLAAFVQTMNDVDVVLRIIDVGLAVAGAVVLLLAGRMVAGRRHAELAVLRARGASLGQLFSRAALGAALVCGPAAALAWAAAVLLFPRAASAGPAAWWPGLATVVVAVAGPGVVTAWQHRLPRRERARWRRWRWVPRVVAEVTACAAAIGAIEVFRAQAGATGLYASAAPVLVAVPAVIVVLRLYQVVVRLLARAAARERGLTGFLGFTRAARATATHALPALTLVLLLVMAAFTGMVRAAVTRGDTAVSWQETGADAVITAPGLTAISPAAQRAIAAVPGVQHAATALVLPVELPNAGRVVTAVAVDPASYAALVASTQGFTPVRASLLADPGGQGAIPVLASPLAAAAFRQPGNDTIAGQLGLPALPVRVAGVLPSTPAVPAGGGFFVLPMSAIHGASALWVNMMLLTGPSIDMTKLHAAVAATMTGDDMPTITTRSSVLAELTGSPVQHGTFTLFTLALGYAAALALAALLLELALGATEREVTLARLATMGLAEGQRVRLVLLELLPAIAASAVAAAACAIALPSLVGQELNLSVFTQSQASPPLRVDPASVLLPLAGLLVVTVIALAHEIRSGRGRGVAVTMRT